MTFDEWWATLTEAEHRIIGKSNARYVWQQACEACASLCEDSVEYAGDELARQIRAMSKS